MGPLACQENQGIIGPGPLYDTQTGVSKLSGKVNIPNLKVTSFVALRSKVIY